jgi:hypothetical protein
MKKLLLVQVTKNVQIHNMQAAISQTIREPSPVLSITAKVKQNKDATPLIITPTPKIL